MPILKPSSALKSCSRKLSQRQSVRLPWAIVVPNGLSFFARSTSTWIHWWSPETSANLSMSSWVTSRQSLGPMVWPTSALSSSIPFTLVGVLMAWSLPVVVPGLGFQGFLQRLLGVGQYRLPVGRKDGVEAELEQCLQCRIEALSVEALDLGVDLVGCPDHQPPIGLRDGIAEDECVVARHVERRLVAARFADAVCGNAARQRDARVDLAERRAVVQALRRGAVAVDGRLGLRLVPAPQLLGAAHVVGDRDEDREAIGERFVDHGKHRGGVRWEQWVDEERRVAGLCGEARDLGAELAGMPFGVPRGPAPEPLAEFLHGPAL